MFCLLYGVHNTKNEYNKQNTFNQAPSTNFKDSAVSDHAWASGHTSTIICELERRNSSLAHQHKVASEVTDKITYNAFLSSYWLRKEEVVSNKLLSLQKQISVTEMKEFKNTSEQIQREMRLLLGQLIKEKLIERVKDAKWFSLLVDEVTLCHYQAVLTLCRLYWRGREATLWFPWGERCPWDIRISRFGEYHEDHHWRAKGLWSKPCNCLRLWLWRCQCHDWQE